MPKLARRSVIESGVGTFVLSLFGTGAVTGQSSGMTDGSTYKYNNRRTGASNNAVPSSPTRNWRLEAANKNAIKGLWPIRTADGSLVVSIESFGPTPGAIVAINPSDGTKQWSVSGRGRVTPPTIRDGTAYVSAGDLFAIDIATGNIEWRESSTKTGIGAPLVIGDLVVAADGAQLRGFDAANGTQEWTADLPGVTTAPLAADGSRIYVPINAPPYGVAAFDTTGTQQWSVSTEAAITSAPCVANSVFVTDGSNTISALEPTDGTIQWQTAVETAVGGVSLKSGSGQLFVPGRDRSYVLNANTGKPLQETKAATLSGVHAQLSIFANDVAIPTHGAVKFVSAANGNERSRIELPENAAATTAVDSGTELVISYTDTGSAVLEGYN